jgi:hypothetical protein
LGYQTGEHEFLQVEGKRRRWQVKLFANGARGHPGLARYDQGAKRSKSVGLGECAKRAHGVNVFHNSIFMELCDEPMTTKPAPKLLAG